MRWLMFAVCTMLVSTAVCAQEEVRGAVAIYDTVYERVDPGAPFQEAPRQPENWQPPAPSAAERAAGFIPFTRGEPFDIKPWSKPKPSERLTNLHTKVALGETTCLWFAIHALEPLREVRIRVEPQQPSTNTPVVKTYYAHFWAQRTDWRGRTYYITPELLLEMRDGQAQFPVAGGVLEWRTLNVPEGESRLFWINIHVPASLSGEYRYALVVQAKGKAAFKIPLKVYVYPFRLHKPPDKRWLLYADAYWIGRLPEEKLLALLQQMSDYGIDGLTELPIGNIDLSALTEGKVQYDPQPLLRWHRLMQQAGLRGPHTIGTFTEDQVPAKLGIQADVNREWDERVREAMRLIARTVVQTLRPYGIDWLFYGWDEPGPETVRALEQYRSWREGGAQTYVTFYQRGTYDAAGQWMTHPCFAVGLVASKQGAEWAYEQCRARQQQFYWYGSGCYLGQEGRLFANRFLTGWLFWKTRADGQVSWTFVRPHEDPFNDFDGSRHNSVEPKDQCTVYPHLSRPNDPDSIVGIIPTIQWEAIREGINDYRYLSTLRNTIAYARKVASGKSTRWAQEVSRAAEDADRTLQMLEQGVPWLNEVGRAGFTNANLQELRVIAGGQIERLVRRLRGERMAPSKRPQAVTLQVEVVPPVSHPVTEAQLPVLTVPRWSQPPVVDGKLDEPQWRVAAVASPFWEMDSSVPMPERIATRGLLAYGDNALYIGMVCRAPYPNRLVADQRQRDAFGIWMDESVEVFLASPDSPERYAHFIINARGTLYDELGFDVGWNTEITVATRTDAQGWTVEIAIPWKSLPFDVDLNATDEPLLRLNLGRNHHQRGEAGVSHWAWSPAFGWFHNTQRFGVVMRQQGNILVTSVTPPSYVDDPPIQLTVLNLSEREEDVEVGGRRVTVPARGEATIEVPSPKTPGDYQYRLQVRWRDGEVTVPVTYSIPRPIQVVQQVGIVKDGVGKIRVAFALRKPEAHRVKVSVAGIPSLRRTLTAGRDFTLRMNDVPQDRLSVRLSVAGFESWSEGAEVHLLPK